LVNCIYWTEKYPRLVTKDYLNQHSDGNLSVIGDISCDIEGSIEITHKSTYPDSATYTYFPVEKQFKDGTLRNGITIMAVDNLPCEFSKESSIEFSRVLRKFIPLLIQENFNVSLEELKLPASIKRGLILHQGKLTEDYIYMKNYLKKENS
jgi:alpha-aminoadipic semialdehyde synthase